jgi:glycosyltransferase involved in cell wall biosynthesis
MKLLTVSHFFENHGGGIERVAAQLSRQFSALGHDARWAASDLDAGPEEPIKAIPLACVDPLERLTGLPMPLPRPRAVTALARAIKTSDAVVIHDALYATSCIAAIFARLHAKPVVLIQHIGFIPFANPFLKTLIRLANLLVTGPMLRFCNHRVLISDTVRRELLGDTSDLSYRLVFNGVDQTIFFPGARARAAFDLPESAKICLFVGRFVEKKGLAILRALAQSRPDLTLALVGSGPIRPECWGLPNVRVFGVLPQARIADFYRCADFLVLPSVGEGYPLVIQEAMACGLPVVCGAEAARADPEAFRWLAGVDIDPAAPEQTAARVAAAIDLMSLAPQQREAMAAYAARAYDWRNMAQVVSALCAA